MRSMIIAVTLSAFAAVAAFTPAHAAKTKMGCTVGKEKWDASAGKCVKGTAKKKSSKKAPKKKAA